MLFPDLSFKTLKYYKYSYKTLLPLLGASILIESIDGDIIYKSEEKVTKISENIKNTFHSVNIANVGFHSYVSVSSVITDYVKPVMISRLCRAANFQGHLLATGGFMYYLFKK